MLDWGEIGPSSQPSSLLKAGAIHGASPRTPRRGEGANVPGGFVLASHPQPGVFQSSGNAGSKWRRPRQPHPGTRIIHYRCFLPDLAEFADYRRGGTDGATMDVGF